MKREGYFVGLDMGTSSVGWAVTDKNYNLLRAKGKDMWGVRLFSEADTAADRRAHRVSRRNLNRRKVRIGLLKELFSDEINKIDPGFYQRLADSKYYLEDKEDNTPFALFADNGYTDKEYYNDYPTVFHLIKELVSEKGKEPHDVRLIFLACLNIFKHRGHFLNDSLSGDGIDDIKELCDDFLNMLNEYIQGLEAETDSYGLSLESKELSSVFQEVLCNKKISGSKKKRELVGILELNNKKKPIIEMVSLVCGLTATISNVFPKDEYDEEQEKMKLSFRSSSLDEDMNKVESMVSQDEYEMICILKKIHDWSVVSVIMGSFSYISEARVASYEKHKSDLQLLKSIYKKYAADKYDSMFREMTENSYSAYVGKVNSNKTSQSGTHNTRMKRRGEKCKQEDFYSRIKKELAKVPEKVMSGVLSDIESGSFLPKQLTNENGVIPYQLHKAELVKILENASAHHKFLNEKDESGLSVKDKIVKLFEFRIPYYVGPLYKDETVRTNAWVVRKEPGQVLPWNFDQKIDEKRSAEIFIEKMVRHCTYLQNETALPKNSLKYERFRVLNELNNLSINGERVSADLKKRIYNELFKVSKKKITKNKLINYLVTSGITDKNPELAGFDGIFANSLLSYGKFCELFGVATLTDKQEAAAEEIIYWATIYGDSKKFLRERIEEKYGPDSELKMLDSKQINRVMGYRFSDWGRFSKAFLNMEGADKETGEIMPLITRMWEESYNLMELLSNRFTYRDELEKQSQSLEKSLLEIDHDDLDSLYISAPVKRMTWQTLQILKEIYSIMGCAPDKVFIEMARADEKKDGKGIRKDSRKKRLEELYKNCKTDSDNLASGLKNCDEASLRSKKLYLYYMQRGKCMYSGNAIDINALFTNDYDIDHIYPQSVTKDDSLDNNMVLVERNYNNKKQDTYPIFREWQSKMKSFWGMLRDEGFLNDEKYKRLTRQEEFTDEELADFVNRQIVETRQATKTIAELIKQSISIDGDNSSSGKVVYVKAGNVSEFRHRFSMKYDRETGKSSVVHPELVKCRLMNDFHHANDAYLNIVVGNVYDVKFTQNPYNYIKEYRRQKDSKNAEKEKYHMDKIFFFNVKRGDQVAWSKSSSLETVLKMMRKNTPIVTRMSYEEHGQLSDLTVYSADTANSKKCEGYIKTKTSDDRLKIERYGGFRSYKGAHFFLVEHTEKEKRVRTLETLPLYLKDKLNTKEKLTAWCADKEDGLGLVDPDIRMEKIKMYSKLRVCGFDLYFTGRGGGDLLLTSNAVQLKIGNENDRENLFWRFYISKLSKYGDSKSEIISEDKNAQLYEIFTRLNSEGIFSKRPNSIGNLLCKGEEVFKQLPIDNQIDTLLSIIKVFGIENQGIDLTSINGKQRSGKMTINKRISDKAEVLLINQSVTGLYENTIDLLTI